MTFSKTYFSKSCSVWEEKNTIPFNELILSWNGIRPKMGKWTFWVGLDGEWLKYAEWGADGQRSFKSDGKCAKCYQDVAIPKELCTEFQVKVEGDLEGLQEMAASVSNLSHHQIVIPENLEAVMLKDVPRQSQLILDHPRHRDLCSPTSTTTALKILTKRIFDPVAFAKKSYDEGFDIYGNWILNVAEAYNQARHPCHVARLSGFGELHAQLMLGRPVIVSVKGEIPGAPKVYHAGHLICIVGYEKGEVFCIDSAFPDNESTFVSYSLEGFLKAWGIRRNLAYIFR